MSPFFPVDRSSVRGPRSARRIPAGEHAYRAGAEGMAWRLHAGAIRLDTTGADGQDAFASLAIAGDTSLITDDLSRAYAEGFTPLMEGDVNFAAVMAELRKMGYDDALLSEVGTGTASFEDTAAAIRKIMAL